MKQIEQEKKVVVLSGGTGYLGNAISTKLAQNDFIVVAIGMELPDTGANKNVNVLTRIADVSDPDAVKEIAREVQEKFGVIFAAIHAASAPLSRRPVLSLSDEEFKLQFLVNVFGAFNFFKSFCAILKEEGAAIGITSSVIFPGDKFPKSGSYTAAKYGLQGLLNSLSAEELFRIYSVAPSFMPGGLNDDLPAAFRDIIVNKSGLEHITNAEAVSNAILSLVNDKEKKWDKRTISMPGFSVMPL